MGKIVSQADLQECYPLADLVGFTPTHRVRVDHGTHVKSYLVSMYGDGGALLWARSPEEDPLLAKASRGPWQFLSGPGKVLAVEEVLYQKSYIRPSDREGFVYFIAREGHVKIGWSQDVDRRLSELQIGSATALSLRGTFPGKLSDESRMHERFSEFRESGEWFRLEGELAEFVRNLAVKGRP